MNAHRPRHFCSPPSARRPVTCPPSGSPRHHAGHGIANDPRALRCGRTRSSNDRRRLCMPVPRSAWRYSPSPPSAVAAGQQHHHHQVQQLDPHRSALASSSTACRSAPPARRRCSSTACELVATADAGRKASSIRPEKQERREVVSSSPLSVPAVPVLSPVLSPELLSARPAENPFHDRDLPACTLSLSPVPARFCLARPFPIAPAAANSAEIGARSMAMRTPSGPRCVRSGAQDADFPREDGFHHRRPQRPTQPGLAGRQQSRHRARVCTWQTNTGARWTTPGTRPGEALTGRRVAGQAWRSGRCTTSPPLRSRSR